MQENWTAEELGDNTGRTSADIVYDDGRSENGRAAVSVVFNEGLRWHREVRNLKAELTSAALYLLAKVIEDELRNATKVTAWLTQDSDDPEEEAVEFAVELDLPLGFTDEMLHTEAWPFIATCINVTDPGTFGAPYIFNALPEGD